MGITFRYSTKNPGKKSGRRRQNKLLSECGKLMINSGKMKDLTSYSFTNISLLSSHPRTLGGGVARGNKEILVTE